MPGFGFGASRIHSRNRCPRLFGPAFSFFLIRTLSPTMSNSTSV
jgi:hypothetical protein